MADVRVATERANSMPNVPNVEARARFRVCDIKKSDFEARYCF